MARIDVRTQAELDRALKSKGVAEGRDWICCLGPGHFTAYDSATVTASGSATVRAYGSATVRAYGSATVRAYGSATVRASGSATVRASGSATVTAYDSATVRASGSATVTASGSATVRASNFVAVHKNTGPYSNPKITGGVIIEVPTCDTTEEWLDYHGIEVKKGKAILYKAVDDDFTTDHSRKREISYTPGSKPKCKDWQATHDCGNGLHFCAKPWIAKDRYNPAATKYVACPVSVEEIVVIDKTKVKAPRVAGKIYECDIDGEKLELSEVSK